MVRGYQRGRHREGKMCDTPMSRFDEATNSELDIVFVGDFVKEASPLGVKGLGELSAMSVALAIANAIFHVTGKRIRDLPIATEKLF
jgi:CO/xanthine dehydrogenase Mo-binding subunit